MQDCVMFKAVRIITKEKLKSSVEEGYFRLIWHVIEAAKCESQRVVIISNNPDAVAYCLAYENRFQFYGHKEVCFHFRTGEKTMNNPIHGMENKLGDHLSSLIILKTHVLTGCDVVQLVRLEQNLLQWSTIQKWFLEDLGIGEPSNAAFKNAEHYLVNII